MAKVPDSVPCAECGHNLAKAVYVVQRDGSTATLYERASWGAMEQAAPPEAFDSKVAAVECPECRRDATAEQCRQLGLP